MKKILRTFCATIAICFTFHNSYSQLCIHYYYFTATKNGNCAVDLEWKYQQCSDGVFYVQYSPTGTEFYTIAIINSTGGNGSDETYQYTDNYACPGVNPNSPVQYRIYFVRTSGVPEISPIRIVDMGDNCSCTNNNTNLCNGIPTITISGSSAICTGTSQTYTLSNSSYGAAWSITSGGSLVSITYSNPVTITISNSSSNGVIVLSANIKGCYTITKTIIVGMPVLTSINMTFQSSCIGGSDWDATFQPNPLLTGVTYLWSVNGGGYYNYNPYWNENYPLNQSSDPSITLNVKYQNACGTSDAMTYPATYYSPCGGYRLEISPNPIKETTILSINRIGTKAPNLLSGPFRATVNIYDQSNLLVRSFVTYNNKVTFNKKGLKQGIYIVQVIIGTQKISKQVIIE